MEKRKALVFFGSPRENGYTKKMLNVFMEELGEIYNFSIIDAYKIAVKPCYGCNFCMKNGICRFSDFNKIKTLLDKADILIIASPVYNLGFPAPLKAIFDRMQPYYNEKLSLKEAIFNTKIRDTVLFLACGRGDNGTSEILLKSLNIILKSIDAKLKCKVVWEETDLNPKINEILPEIKTVVEKIK